MRKFVSHVYRMRYFQQRAGRKSNNARQNMINLEWYQMEVDKMLNKFLHALKEALADENDLRPFGAECETSAAADEETPASLEVAGSLPGEPSEETSVTDRPRRQSARK